jgi:DmsE family decaheme c-type cytochrome
MNPTANQARGRASRRCSASVFRGLLVLAACTVAAVAAAQGGAPEPAASAASASSAAVAASAAAPVLASTAASAPAPAGQGTQYSEKGADTCLECHDDESATYSKKAIFETKHGQRGNAHAPFGPGGLQCEACHGPGARHVAAKGKQKLLTINTFKADSFLSVEQRNEACLSCHRGRARTQWYAGAHASAQLACTNCHKMHTGPDPVLTKSSQPEVCYRCHKQQQADFQKTSSHPVRFGRIACSDCHNPHGSSGPSMLAQPTLNQTCYTCHAEKRGPLLWEHAPVAEDCSLCHFAHGSVRDALLKKSPPLLCQQCHEPAGHPSVAYNGGALPGNAPGGTTAGASVFLLAGGCTNCHSQVHGSNHPSGSKLMR